MTFIALVMFLNNHVMTISDLLYFGGHLSSHFGIFKLSTLILIYNPHNRILWTWKYTLRHQNYLPNYFRIQDMATVVFWCLKRKICNKTVHTYLTETLTSLSTIPLSTRLHGTWWYSNHYFPFYHGFPCYRGYPY